MADQYSLDIARLIDENARMRHEVEALKSHRDQLQKAVDVKVGQGLLPTEAQELRLLVENLRGQLKVHRDAHRLHSQEMEHRVAALESLTSDQADALERQSRVIEELRAAMGNAQATIRGLGRRYLAGEDG